MLIKENSLFPASPRKASKKPALNTISQKKLGEHSEKKTEEKLQTGAVGRIILPKLAPMTDALEKEAETNEGDEEKQQAALPGEGAEVEPTKPESPTSAKSFNVEPESPTSAKSFNVGDIAVRAGS